MKRILLAISMGGFSLALAACGGGDATNEGESGQQANAAAAATAEQTIAAGLDENSRFSQAAKAAGLDATLAGPGPYTVLVASDEAFGTLPQGNLDNLMQPQSRAELIDLLTYHILPGTVLVEDIERAIENSNGSAILATMGGETLTASRDGDRIVLTDASGGKATIVQGDQRRSNGVVHVVDAVLVPAPAAEGGAQENTSG